MKFYLVTCSSLPMFIENVDNSPLIALSRLAHVRQVFPDAVLMTPTLYDAVTHRNLFVHMQYYRRLREKCIEFCVKRRDGRQRATILYKRLQRLISRMLAKGTTIHSAYQDVIATLGVEYEAHGVD